MFLTDVECEGDNFTVDEIFCTLNDGGQNSTVPGDINLENLDFLLLENGILKDFGE